MRLTDKQKAEVITDYTAGKTKSDIARKFNISITAVSKILKNKKSLEKVQKSSKSSAEIRKDIISRAETALSEKDFNKLAPETLLKIIERLSILEDTKQQGNDLKIIVERKVVDLTNKNDDDKL